MIMSPFISLTHRRLPKGLPYGRLSPSMSFKATSKWECGTAATHFWIAPTYQSQLIHIDKCVN